MADTAMALCDPRHSDFMAGRRGPFLKPEIADFVATATLCEPPIPLVCPFMLPMMCSRVAVFMCVCVRSRARIQPCHVAGVI